MVPMLSICLTLLHILVVMSRQQLFPVIKCHE